MNIELARTFLEVVAAGSLAGAAERLHVTHSTVTMRIKSLEDILRRKVLNRNRSGVTMTAAGAQFHPYAETLVRTWQMTRRQLSLASGYESILSVGADTSLWDDLMFDWACQTREERPEIALRCESGTSDQLIERLFHGWLDFCVVYEVKSRGGFVSEPLFNDQIIYLTSEQREVKGHWDPEYVEVEWDEGIRDQIVRHWGDVDETPGVWVDNKALGIRFMERFGGSILVPKRCYDKGTLPMKLYELEGQPLLDRQVYIMYPEEYRRNPSKKLGIDTVKEGILGLL